MESPGTSLDAIPDLSGGRWSTLGPDEVIDSGLKSSKRALHVGTVVNARPQEGSVDGQQDPAPTLEQDGAKQKATPQGDLKARDNGHGRVVVLLDEAADGVGDGMGVVLGLRAGRGTGRGRGLGGRNDSRDDGGARVGCKVEDGVDAVGQQGNWVLRGQEPHERQDCDGEKKLARCPNKGENIALLHRIKSWRKPTEILDVLVSDQRDSDLRRKLHAGLGASAKGLVDDNAIGEHSGDKGEAVGELGHSGVVVHSDP